MSDLKQFKVENAQIIFRNFSGKESMYNDAGDRNFCVVLDDGVAADMDKDGWNIKYTKPREEGEPPVPYIQIKVNFKNKPPRVVMITSTGRTNLNQDSVEVLDWADIRNADLICNGFDWVVGDKNGTKAYLKTLFITIEEDDLERKYGINDMDEVE